MTKVNVIKAVVAETPNRIWLEVSSGKSSRMRRINGAIAVQITMPRRAEEEEEEEGGGARYFLSFLVEGGSFLGEIAFLGAGDLLRGAMVAS